MTSLKLAQETSTAATLSPVKYRHDIDGLRAIAVGTVVLFHAFPSALRGGFIGVDIFFVISGFLISSILIRELSVSDFSIGRFYSRRIARIFPALVAVLTACLVFGWLALLSDEYTSLAKHALAGAGFVSNLLLWSEASYFDVASDTKPLLHLWSLGVEEQFYLVWPLLLAALWRVRLKVSLMTAIGIIIALSLGVNLYQSTQNPTADFYSPLTRFWELLVGAWVACSGSRWRPSTVTSNTMSCAGVALIALGLVTITSEDAFPGALALLPVCGAALLMGAGPYGMVNRTLLSNRVLVGLGLISYPLYLWHWPLLAFPRILDSATPPAANRAVLVAVAVALAWATYRYIERPVRQNKVAKATVVKGLCSALVLIAAGAATIFLNNGFGSRSGANPVELYPGTLGNEPYLAYLGKNFYQCSDQTLKKMASKDNRYGYRCFQSKPSGPIDMLLLGDSHAEQLLPGVAEQFQSLNVASFLQHELPVLDWKGFEGVFQYVAADKDIKTVVVAAIWGTKITHNMEDLTARLTATFDVFNRSNKKVYVFDDIPTFVFDPQKCKYGRRFASSNPECSYSVASGKGPSMFYMQPLQAAVAANGKVKFVSVRKYFCDAIVCRMTDGQSILYRDDNHLSISGSKYLADKLVQDKVFD
ncbi:acyltransferase family protein [Pseudomonas sp. TE3610]